MWHVPVGPSLAHQEELLQLRSGGESGRWLGVPRDITKVLSRAVVGTEAKDVHCKDRVALTQAPG